MFTEHLCCCCSLLLSKCTFQPRTQHITCVQCNPVCLCFTYLLCLSSVCVESVDCRQNFVSVYTHTKFGRQRPIDWLCPLCISLCVARCVALYISRCVSMRVFHGCLAVCRVLYFTLCLTACVPLCASHCVSHCVACAAASDSAANSRCAK